MADRKTFLKQQIVKYSLKLDEKGFGANHDGNISVKFDDQLLATPTAVSKGNMTVDMVITLDQDGKKIEGIGNPFSEIKLHLAAYRARPDAKAVVHAHPPYTTARGLVGAPLNPILPEAIVSIGDHIPVVEFAMPGDAQNDTIIANALTKTDVFMMPGNGVLAIGDDIEQAYLRIELIEHLAKIESYMSQMGQPMKLFDDDVQKMLQKRQKAGLGPQARNTSPSSDPSLKDLIAQEIKKVLTE